MSKNIALGLTNVAGDASLGTVTAGSTASASLAASNVQDKQQQKVWRSASASFSNSNDLGYLKSNQWLNWQSLSALEYGVDAVAIMNHNFVRAPNQILDVFCWRTRGASLSSSVTLASLVHLVPNSIKTQTNLTGAISTVQESPWNRDSTGMSATSHTSNTVLRVDFSGQFASEGLALRSGTDKQCFTVWVRRSASGGSDPSAEVQLLENGSVVSTVVPSTVISSDRALTGYWDASTLSSLTTTQTELRINGTAGSNATVEPVAIEWQVDHTGYAFDSGDVGNTSPPVSGGDDPPIGSGVRSDGRSNFVHYLSNTATIGNGTNKNGNVLVDFRNVSYAYFYGEVGYLFVGQLWRPAINMEWDPKLGYDDRSTFRESFGGQEWSVKRNRRRVLTAELANLTESEAYDYLFAKDRTDGTSGPILVSIDSDNEDRAGDWTFLARQATTTEIGNKYVGVYQKPLILRELL